MLASILVLAAGVFMISRGGTMLLDQNTQGVGLAVLGLLLVGFALGWFLQKIWSERK